MSNAQGGRESPKVQKGTHPDSWWRNTLASSQKVWMTGHIWMKLRTRHKHKEVLSLNRISDQNSAQRPTEPLNQRSQSRQPLTYCFNFNMLQPMDLLRIWRLEKPKSRSSAVSDRSTQPLLEEVSWLMKHDMELASRGHGVHSCPPIPRFQRPTSPGKSAKSSDGTSNGGQTQSKVQ